MKELYTKIEIQIKLSYTEIKLLYTEIKLLYTEIEIQIKLLYTGITAIQKERLQSVKQ